MKIKWYSILIPISMAGLLAMLSSWLWSSYKAEKENLLTELEYQVSQVRSEIQEERWTGLVEFLVEADASSDSLIKHSVTSNVRRFDPGNIDSIIKRDLTEIGSYIALPEMDSVNVNNSIKISLIERKEPIDTSGRWLIRSKNHFQNAQAFNVVLSDEKGASFHLNDSHIHEGDLFTFETKLAEKVESEQLPTNFKLVNQAIDGDTCKGLLINVNESLGGQRNVVASFEEYKGNLSFQ